MTRQTGRIPLLGYADRLSVRPGEAIGFKISAHGPGPVAAWLTRSISADPNPDGPGIVEQPVDASFAGDYPARVQAFNPGSYARVDGAGGLDTSEGITLTARIWPTLPGDERAQAVIALGDLRLGLDAEGRLEARAGEAIATAPGALKRERWYAVSLHLADGALSVAWEALPHGRADSPRAGDGETARADAPRDPAPAGVLTIAAALDADGAAADHFDGKIEAPRVLAADGRVLAAWDFARETEGLTVVDTGPHGLDGTLVNLPARAMTGADWDGSAFCWREKPDHYGAIHFHSDDIVDFGWDDDIRWTLPDDLPTGIYVCRLKCGEVEDAIPFFVPPPKGTRTADLAVLVSTFTYTVYGNHARPDFAEFWRERFTAWNAYPYNPADYPEYGQSTYNRHRDGSGLCHASFRRPLFTLKPGYVTFGYGEGSGLRHFPADSHLIAWLHARGIAYDIVTDEMLDEEGAAALSGYKALTTGSHPEYHTANTLDALTAFRDGGGKLAYLGGNGFYWKIARHKDLPGAIEVRRPEGGIRAWDAKPGEGYLAFDGGHAGLWRRQGRPPQLLVGIGFSAQGQFEADAYRIAEVDPNAPGAWILEGLKAGDLLGDFGFSGGGAAGFELDRADPMLGSPDEITILARSAGAPESFVTVPEEMLTHITTVNGEPPEALKRADMVYFDVPGGGAVFATGSITFCGSLPSNGFDNPVGDLLERVFRGFLA